MTPQGMIDALDGALAKAGSGTVTLRRLPSTDVDCVCSLRGFAANELVAGIIQGDSLIIISPTQINAATWPAVQVDGAPDVRVPNKNKGDLAIINGRTRSVQSANPFYVNGVLVRIEIQVR